MAFTGRPPVQINPKELTALAAQGLTNREIMRCLGISEETFYKKKRQLKEFNEALEEGRARGTAKITNVLFNKAAAGDNACMFFYLERRAGWIRQENLKHEGEIGGKYEHQYSFDIESRSVLRRFLEDLKLIEGPGGADTPVPGDGEA
jgi:hypothetical protein